MSGKLIHRLLNNGAKRLGTAAPAASTDINPVMPPLDYTPPKYEGLSKDECKKIRAAHVAPAVHRQTFHKEQPLFVAGKGQYLFDENGVRYLDLMGGICTVSAGHAHDAVNAAITDQMSRVSHTSNIFLHNKIHEYSKAMIDKMPKDSNLSVVYFCNSGSEANDLAMLMARAYTGYLNIVGLRRAYHGASATNIALTAMPLYRHASMPITNVSQTMSPDPYRGLWGGSHCRDGSPCQTLRSCDCAPDVCDGAEMYAQQYRDHLLTLCPGGKGLAGFIGEGMGGMTAAMMQSKGFYKKAYEITKSFGGVNIMDEVQTGFGRLGTHYWGFEYHGVRPDIITAAKSIGNGFPLAMAVTTPEIAEAFANSSLHFNTFGGNAVASAAGLATLKAIDDDGLMENSRIVGNRFLEGFNYLREKYDHVGDCRGKGLMMAMEFVESKSTNNPMPTYKMNAILERTKDLGILLGKGGLYANCFRIQPPMCVSLEDADFTIQVMDKVFAEYQEGKIDVEAFNPNPAK